MSNIKEDKNIVLIVCDCLRTDYAYDPEIMPFLNTLKKKWTSADKAYTNASSTYFAMPTMMTGFMPLEVTDKSGINSSNIKNYLPKIYKGRGYKTTGITANIVTSRLYGYDKYFDFFEDFWETKSSERKYRKLKSIASRIPESIKKTLLRPVKRITKKFLKNQNVSIQSKVRGKQILNTLKKQDFEKKGNFIFLLFMEPHTPYAPIKRKDEFKKIEKITKKIYKKESKITEKEATYIKRLYEEECKDLDNYIKKTIEHLKSKIDWECTTIIITADHGEAFGETGYYTHPNERVDNINHIRVPLVTNNKAFIKNTDKVWTKDLYNFLSKNSQEENNYNFCVGYKAVEGKILPNKQRYEPIRINNLKRIIPVDNVKEIYKKRKNKITDQVKI